MKLKQYISDGAIFQRNEKIAISGVTDTKGVIQITIAGKTYYGAAGADGSFLVRIPPMPAGGPYTLTVTNMKSADTIRINDILIGELWLGAGQSNMELPFCETPQQRREFQKNDLASDEIRIFMVKRCASSAAENDVSGQWEKSSTAAVNKFSAVSLWFAKELHSKLKVPVGIIVSAWGGTKIQSWISRQSLLHDEYWKKRIEEYDAAVVLPERWDAEKIMPYNERMDHIFSEFYDDTPPNTGLENNWHTFECDESKWTPFSIPRSWIQSSLSGNGTVWIRKHIKLPENWLNKDLELQLGGIDKHDITYFNGIEIGRTGNKFDQLKWNVPRIYQIPGNLIQNTDNLLAVRAYSFTGDGSFNGNAEDYSLYCNELKETIIISGDVLFRTEHDLGKTVPPPPERFNLPEGPEQINTPSLLFNSMIRPLIPCAIKGIIWYQGEENSWNLHDASTYNKMLPMLINDWRFYWGLGDIPFIITQIANFGEEKNYDENSLWAKVRQAQLQTAMTVPAACMAVTIDIGEAGDLHPKDKRTVGQRLAARALYNVYHTDIHDFCPYPLQKKISGDTIEIHFSCNPGEINLRTVPESMFFICGDDMKYYPAEAELNGNCLTLQSKKVKAPCHVRYAWADNPGYPALFTQSNEPVTPFEL